MDWRVLQVRPRCEKKLASYCLANRLTHYLPLKQEVKIYQRRRVEVHKPLFPGYVFAAFEQPDRALVLKSNLIARVIEVNNQRRFLHELEQVRLALEVNPCLGTCEPLRAGQRVRIVTGPFMGIEGIVHQARGAAKVVLNVDIISKAVALEVEVAMLEPLPD